MHKGRPFSWSGGLGKNLVGRDGEGEGTQFSAHCHPGSAAKQENGMVMWNTEN